MIKELPHKFYRGNGLIDARVNPPIGAVNDHIGIWPSGGSGFYFSVLHIILNQCSVKIREAFARQLTVDPRSHKNEIVIKNVRRHFL